MNELVQVIREELRLRILNEGIPRIQKCLHLLSEDDIWNWPNNEIPSIGNLILHLNGNVRQWFLDGFCGISYTRLRENEFNARKSHTKEQLLELLNTLSVDLDRNMYLINLNILLQEKTIQRHFNVTGYGIINHITEHFSYHVGQIATITKLATNKDLGFYEDLDL